MNIHAPNYGLQVEELVGQWDVRISVKWFTDQVSNLVCILTWRWHANGSLQQHDTNITMQKQNFAMS